MRLLEEKERKVQMGTFVTFMGDVAVPEEKRELFNRYMQKILDIGGIMDLSRVEFVFDEISLLEPVDLSDGKKHGFSFNYFEDCKPGIRQNHQAARYVLGSWKSGSHPQ